VVYFRALNWPRRSTITANWRHCGVLVAPTVPIEGPLPGKSVLVETMPEKSTVRLNLSDSDEDSEIEANAPSVDRNVSDGDPQVVPHDTEQDIVDTKKFELSS
jgi:hypothetical protein